jgi:hypothetical protein
MLLGHNISFTNLQNITSGNEPREHTRESKFSIIKAVLWVQLTSLPLHTAYNEFLS